MNRCRCHLVPKDLPGDCNQAGDSRRPRTWKGTDESRNSFGKVRNSSEHRLQQRYGASLKMYVACPDKQNPYVV